MATYVIVHGGWGGGWEWQAVARGLAAEGHEVHCPTLTGLGERAHLASPAVGLSTHVQDVVAMLTALELRDLLLVGQSYGGMVVTGVVDRAPELIRRVVYLDAFVPVHGESCNDLCGAAFATRVRQLADEQGQGWLVPFPFVGDLGLPSDVAAWYLPRLVPHPLATLDDPADLSHGGGAGLPRVFVRFLDEPDVEQEDAITGSARRARQAGWDVRQLVAAHDLHVSDPSAMVALLCGFA